MTKVRVGMGMANAKTMVAPRRTRYMPRAPRLHPWLQTPVVRTRDATALGPPSTQLQFENFVSLILLRQPPKQGEKYVAPADLSHSGR